MEFKNLSKVSELGKSLPTSNIDQIKSEVVDELYRDPFIKKFLDENKKDSSFVEKNLVLLMDMKEGNKNCLNCPGYLKCLNRPKGYQQTILLNEYDNKTKYVMCDKLAEISPILDAYINRDFEESWIYNNIVNLPEKAVSSTLRIKAIDIVKNPNRGLYLYGSSGSGKSYIASAIVNSIIDLHGYKAAFVNFKNILEEIKDSFGDNESSNVKEETINKYSEVDVLVLDDLGGEKPSEWSVQDILYEIISRRLHNHKITFFTSMYSLKDLQKAYGGSYNLKVQRVIDTINALAEPCLIEGINYNLF